MEQKYILYIILAFVLGFLLKSLIDKKYFYIENFFIDLKSLKDSIGVDYLYNFTDIVNVQNIGAFTNNGTITNGDSNTISAVNDFKSINLNGTNQYITIPGYMFTNKGFTISFWGKFNVPNTQSKNVITFIEDSTQLPIIQVNLFSGNNLYLNYNDGTNLSQVFNYEKNGDNTWRFYTYTMTPSVSGTGTMKAFVNGELKWTQANTYYPNTTSTITLILGKDPIQNNYTEMSLSQLFIKNDVLSDDNIKKIYNLLFTKAALAPLPVTPQTAPLSTLQSQWNTIGCKSNLTENDVAWWRTKDNDTVKNDMLEYYKLASTCSGTQGQNDFCLPNSCTPPPTTSEETAKETASVESASVDKTPQSIDTTPIDFKSFRRKIMGQSKDGETIKMYKSLNKCATECATNKKCIGIIHKKNGFNNNLDNICKTIKDFSKPHNSSNSITYLKK